MANVTLSVDDDVLQKAWEAALREHTSVNALVREYLIRYTEACSRRVEALDTLSELAQHNPSQGSGQWSRESLHER